MKERTDVTAIWRDYQRGVDFLNKRNLYERVRQCYMFAQSDQWDGLLTDGARMPQLNFLRPTMKYSVAIVAQNGMTINYSSMDYSANRKVSIGICELLNKYAAETWERLKMDKYLWDIAESACISGDCFTWFYDDVVKGKHVLKMEMPDNTNVMLADEQNADIQTQPYILIVQRRYVADVRREAQANGISKDDISLILPDNDDENDQEVMDEVENELKCITVLKMYKQDGKIFIARSTRSVIFQRDTEIKGLTLYPLVKYSWNIEHGYARGLGDIWDKIPNQIEVNKSLARLSYGIRDYAFPHAIYDKNVLDPESVQNLKVVGSSIELNGSVGKVSDYLTYMQPPQINAVAKEFPTELMQQTRELAGAGEAVTGNIDPQKASGAAIIAAHDTNALTLNQQQGGLKQCIEDIASVWIDMWRAYMVDGITVMIDDQPVPIPYEALQGIEVSVKIDVSPTNPYSKYAAEQGLTQLLQAQYIPFEYFVEALDDDSSLPKQKLVEIVDKMKTQQKMIDDMKSQYEYEIQRRDIAMQKIAEENAQLQQQTQDMPKYLEQATKTGMDKQAAEDTRLQRLAELEAAAGKIKGGGANAKP